MVIKNSTLDYIVQKSVYYISKHLGGYKVIYVNCNPPSFEKFCNYTELLKDINGEEVTKGVSSKKGTIDSTTAGTVTSGIVIVIIIAGVFIWRKKYEINDDFRYMKIHIFALRWRDEIKRSSQLRRLLKRVVVNRTRSGPIYNYSFQ